MALQAENYALEKQVYSYQQSIARNNSVSGSTSKWQSADSMEDPFPERRREK